MAVRVKKGNRVLRVDETLINKYLATGYEQIDKKGNVIKPATGGRTVSLAEHNKVVNELNQLKDAQGGEDLKKENTALKGKVTKLEKKVKELEEALEKTDGNNPEDGKKEE